MVPLSSLWLPVLLSAVFVFFASFLAHMVLTHHHSDFGKVPSENDVMDALRKFNIPAGDYMIPCGGGPEAMKSPEFIEKMSKGPVAVMTFIPPGPPSMASNLIQWFVFCIVVNVFAGYVAGAALGPGARYLAVFRFAGTTAFTAYALGLWQNSIWYKRSWSSTIKTTIDGLVYAGLTAGTFGWLWPR
jgi:hypothetical protein